MTSFLQNHIKRYGRGGIFDAAPSRMPSNAMASTDAPAQQQDAVAPVQQPGEPPAPTPLTWAMQQPNRLDGHPFSPIRASMAREPGPYFVDDDPWDCPGLPHAVRLKQLKLMNNYEDGEQSSDDAEPSGAHGSHDQCYIAAALSAACIADAFLIVMATPSEVFPERLLSRGS